MCLELADGCRYARPILRNQFGNQSGNQSGNGFVHRFNMNGVRDLTFGINNGQLDAPWGIALAPASFGIFGSALLIGNFADGGDPDALYFAAGIGHGAHGLFGSLRTTTTVVTSLVRFSATDYVTNETAGSISITVVREGDTTGAATVNYGAFVDLQPNQASAGDFTLAPGTLSFAAGETSRAFIVGINNDALVETAESLTLVLSNPAGAVSRPAWSHLHVCIVAG